MNIKLETMNSRFNKVGCVVPFTGAGHLFWGNDDSKGTLL